LTYFAQQWVLDLIQSVTPVGAGRLVISVLLSSNCARAKSNVPFESVGVAEGRAATSAHTLMLRIAGYREALLNSAIIPDQKWIHSGNPSDRQFIQSIVDGGATAIICANDLTAANLMRTLDLLGCPVPHKIRVTGFDDVRYAELLRPSLTTIHQPCTDIGTIAIQVMLERINNPTFPPRDILVQPTLVVRQSCGAAGTSHSSSVSE